MARSSKGNSGKSKSSRSKRHPDIEMATIAVRGGFVSSQQAKETLREVKRRARKGKDQRTSFLRMLLERQLLDRDACARLAREVERHTYICDNCERRCVLAPSSRRMLTCPRCDQPIEAVYTEHSNRGGLLETEPRASTASEPPGVDKILKKELVLGRYKATEELGRGAMGVVYRARHIELKKDVALKVLMAGIGAKPSHVKRFKREAAAVARLNHPNIVRVYDFGVEEDVYILAMDLVEGGYSFHDALKEEGALNLEERLVIIEKVARAMQHAHDANIVHRDLKPANILLTPKGEPLVADFGLAKDFEEDDELTQPEARVGTPLFLAPECIHQGASGVDERADVWSLGVMLFCAVTGRYPFRAKTVMELYVQVLQEDPDWDGDRVAKLVSSQSEQATQRLQQPFIPGARVFPAPLLDICERALLKDADARIGRAEEFADELRDFLEGDEASRSATRRRRTRAADAPASKLNSLLLAFGVGLLVIIGASIALRDAFQEGGPPPAATGQVQLAWDIASQGPQAWSEQSLRAVEAQLSSILTTRPDDAEGLLRRGEARLYLLEDEGAEADLRRAYELGEPRIRLEAALAMGRLTLANRRFDESLQWTAQAAPPEAPELEALRRRLRAGVWLDRREPADLEILEGEFAELAKSDPEAAMVCGTARWYRGTYGNAVQHFEDASKLGAGIDAQIGLLSSQLQLGRADPLDARREFDELVKQQRAAMTGLPRAYVQRAEDLIGALVDRGRRSVPSAEEFEPALRLLRRARLEQPWLITAWDLEGVLLKGADRIREGMRVLHTACALAPHDSTILNERAYLLRVACTPSDLEFIVQAYEQEKAWATRNAYRHIRDLATAYYSLNQSGRAWDQLQDTEVQSNLQIFGWMLLDHLAVELKKPNADYIRGKYEEVRGDPKLQTYKVQIGYNAIARAELLRDQNGAARKALEAAQSLDSWGSDKNGRTDGESLFLIAALAGKEGQVTPCMEALEQAASRGGVKLYELDNFPGLEAAREKPSVQRIRAELAEKSTDAAWGYFLQSWKELRRDRR